MSAPPGWERVTLDPSADRPQPIQPGPYLVGYGEEWCEYTEWGEAWLAHIMRGSTHGASHLLAARQNETRPKWEPPEGTMPDLVHITT